MTSCMAASASASVRSSRSTTLAMASLIIGRRLERQEVAEQVFARPSQDGLRMKLHPFHSQGPVAQAHDLALGGLGRDLQAGRQRLPFNDQRVIARRFKRVRQVLEDRLAVVLDLGRLPVHQALSTDHVAAEGFADALVTQAHAQDRHGPGEITIREGLSAAISSTVIASLRTTRTSSPSSPRYWTRL